jgi:hypothetical protein
MKRQRSPLLACAAAAVFTLACGDSTAPKDHAAGPVVSTDGLARLTVPASAVPSGVTLTIVDATATAPVIAMGRVYRIGPAGTQFSSPGSLSITLPFDPADVWTDISGHDLAITRLDGDRWTTLESAYDPATRTLTAEITHLSAFGYNLPVRAQSIVEDGDPARVWADEWRGEVTAVLMLDEGGQPVHFEPGLKRATVGCLGDSTSPMAFLNRTFDPGTLEVRWDPGLASVCYFLENALPATTHPTCPGRFTLGVEWAESELQRKDPAPTSLLAVNTQLRRYVLNFGLRPGQTVAVRSTVFCLEIPDGDGGYYHETIADGVRHRPLDRVGGEMGEELPTDGPTLSGERTWDVQAPVIRDALTWDLEPYYYPAIWKHNYASVLRARPNIMVRSSMWEKIDQECAAGGRSGISCRAAALHLKRIEVMIDRWINDCERIQAAVLHGTVTPLLTGTGYYDEAVLQGPVDFCWDTHNRLVKLIPTYPSGSITQFRDRLNYELRKLYTVSDLHRLFDP